MLVYIRELHWLPVRRRVELALNNLAPPYLVDDCNLVSDDTRGLCSAASVTCTVPRTRTRLGGRSFAVAGPQVWNSLCCTAGRRGLRTVQSATKDTFVWLIEAAAPSDFCF